MTVGLLCLTSPPAGVTGKVVMNGFATIPNNQYAFKNFYKGSCSPNFGSYAYPQNLDTNGYPTVGTLTTGGSFVYAVPPSYTGNWRISWLGKLACVITAGGGATIVSDPSGVASGSVLITINGGGSSVTRTTVDFKHTSTPSSVSITYSAGGNFTGLSDLRIYRISAPYTGDDAAIAGGVLEEQFNTDFIADLVTLNSPVIRQLDCAPINFSAITQSTETNQTANASYVWSAFKPSTYAGLASSSDGGLTYTCGPAPSSPAGSYVQGETVQCQMQVDATSTTATLNVNGRGAKPIKSWAFGAPGNLPISSDSRRIIANALWTFTYHAISDTWVGTAGGNVSHWPLSMRVALCNKLNKDYWHQFPFLYDNASILADIAYIRDNLRSNLNCYWELSNEVWNGAFFQTNQAISLGLSLGFPNSSNRPYHGAYALKFSQITDLIAATWSPRTSSQLRGLFQYQNGGDGTTTTYRMQGADLGAYGYSTVGNRPIDKCYGAGSAHYIAGALIRGPGAYSSGYLAGEISGFTTACDNYASGVPSQMSSALDWIDNDLRQGLKNGTLGGEAIDFVVGTRTAAWNTIQAGYGKPMVMYEGGYEGIAPSTAECTSIFGISTAYSAKAATLIAAYLLDDRFKASTLYQYTSLFALSQMKYAAQYAYGGGNVWALRTGDLNSTNYKSYDAIVIENS